MNRFLRVAEVLSTISVRGMACGAAATLLLGAAALRAAEMPADHPSAAKPISAADLAFFESKIRPVLIDNCYKCHSKQADKVRGGFLIDTREAILHGGNTGAAIVPGKPEESLLIQAINYKDEDLQMPPKGEKLTAAQIADLTEWVRRGAPDPRTGVAKGSSAAYAGVGKQHWAFQPVKKPGLPTVQNAAWIKNPVDNFVLAKLEGAGMTPNAPAEKATLIRRIYFDLIGMPPTVRDVQAFLNDNSPDAFAKVVDRLLSSPQYGEHWARYWLDVARYSDTKGDAQRQDDLRYPHAWTYRDWVIDAFNADLPYDKFIIAQIAGDRMHAMIEKNAKDKKQPLPETRTMLAAQGFLTLGNQFNGRKDDIIGDQIDVTTKAFLGLTVACARCHDHKFDPIPTKDYYSLYGVFANSTQPTELPTMKITPPQTSELLDYMAKAAAIDQRQSELKVEVAAMKKSYGGKAKGKDAGPVAKMDPNKRREIQRMERELQRDIGNLETQHAGAPARVNALYDAPRVRDYNVLLRGEPNNKGDIVPRRFLEVLATVLSSHKVAAGETLASLAKKYDMKADEILAANKPALKGAGDVKPGVTIKIPGQRTEWKNGSGRAELALAIADPKNPLTARVFVNRMWQQHWGVGFVDTPDDLGNMSSAPTHPELLDWLAATFVEQGWSIKQLHRTMVLSAAYQQSSQNNPKFAEQDPNNKLMWRFNLRRLDFEELHDSLLAITGELDLTRGGRPVPISSGEFAKRRAIYTLIDRTNPAELLTQFDFPSPDVSSGRRYETLVPQQALFLMNSPMVIETARKLATHPAFTQLKTDEERVTVLYLAIYQRMPSKQEVALGLNYVKANPTGTGLEMPEPLVVAQVDPRQQRKTEMQKMAQRKQQGKFSTQVGGVYETNQPLNAWTKLAHALFQSNEAMFYN